MTRATRQLVTVMIVLLCLPLRADTVEVDLAINGIPYVPAVPESIVVKPDRGPIYTANMPGDTFDAQLRAAIELSETWQGERKIVWESGWQSIDKTVEIPAKTGWRHVAYYTPLFWSESVPDTYNAPMLRLLGGWCMGIDGAHCKGKKIKSQFDVQGDAGVELFPDYAAGKNTARNIQLERMRFSNFDRGLLIGDFSGPDLTEVVVRDSAFTGCRIGVQAAGANVIASVQDCAFTGRTMTSGVHVIYSSNRHFDGITKPQYVDAWGKPRKWDWCKTNAWRARLLDSEGRSGLNPAFDSATARAGGGGPDVTIRDCNFSFGDNSDLEDRYAVLSDGCHFELIGARIEGRAGAAKINAIHSNPNMHGNRFECLLRDVHTVSKHTKPIVVERKSHNAGFALRVDGGYYANPGLPESSDDLGRGIVILDGPLGPEGVIE